MITNEKVSVCLDTIWRAASSVVLGGTDIIASESLDSQSKGSPDPSLGSTLLFKSPTFFKSPTGSSFDFSLPTFDSVVPSLAMGFSVTSSTDKLANGSEE